MTTTNPPAAPIEAMRDTVWVDYTNYRGERSIRHIRPLEINMLSTIWHPEPQWLLSAFDMEKQVWRDFALKDIHAWSDTALSASPAEKPPGREADLEAEIERLKREADGQFVEAAVRVMQAHPDFNARDYNLDGITADDFETFFTEDMNEAWRQVEKLQAEVASLKAALSATGSATSREDCPLEQPNPPHTCPKCGMTNNNTCPVGDEEIG